MEKKLALRQLERIPWIGKKSAARLWDIGIKKTEDLKNQDPEKLYQKMERKQGSPIDQCMLYVLRCAVYYATERVHDPDLLNWWAWKDRASH